MSLTTPGGSPASWQIWPRRMVVRGVSDAGLMTTVLPAASAGASFHEASRSGKLNGVIAATTPIGSRSV